MSARQVIQPFLGLKPFVLLEISERGTLEVTFGGGVKAEDVGEFIEIAYASSRSDDGEAQ